MKLEKYCVYRLDLPVQNITRGGENRKSITVTGTEMHGPHSGIVVAVAPDDSFAVVVPLTSAQDTAGGERWSVAKKSWLRMQHKGKPVYALTEQIRYADRGRFYDAEQFIGEYDQQQLDLKLKALLGFI
jgi:hypothetical protein